MKRLLNPNAILITISRFYDCLVDAACRDRVAGCKEADKVSYKENSMGTAFEIALICDLKPGLPQEVIDTLAYMTRDEDYDFNTTLKEDIFGFDEEYEVPLDGWRHIINNISAQETIERNGFAGDRISLFTGDMLCFRQLAGDDCFCNDFYSFMVWLARLATRYRMKLPGYMWIFLVLSKI